MEQHFRAMCAAALMLAVSAGAVQAQDEAVQAYPQGGQGSGYAAPAYQGQGGYQAAPAASGNIIGYRPITNESLGSIVSGQPQATQAYPMSLGAPGQAGAGQMQSPTGGLPSSYQTGILGDGPYTLGRDDVIQIDVRNQPEFSGHYQIGFDGRIQYSYIGDIPIAGLTKYEVQQVLEKLLEKYIRVPSVGVQILAYNSKVVYVIGEVRSPGKFIMRGDAIKLREAILAAGLPTRYAALKRVHVIQPALAEPRVRVINVKKILYKGKLKDDVDLFPGEIVVIPSTVLSSVNLFLGDLLSPITRGARVAALGSL